MISPSEPLVSVSSLGSNVTIVRFAAHTTEDCYELLAEILSPLSSGALEELPKPYADRIHRLPAQQKRDASLDMENTAAQYQSSPPEAAHNHNGTAITAMHMYDQMLVENKILP